jgi:Histone H1-like nucleoprotein HC2
MTALLLVDRLSGRTFVHFTVGDDDHEVSVVGSFNDWVPGVHPLVRQDDGSRSVLVEVQHPGDVHFRYLGSDGRWFDDPTAHVIDEYGSTLRRDAAAVTDVLGIATDPVADPDVGTSRVTKKAAAKKAAKKATKKAAKKAAVKKAVAKKAAVKKAVAKKTPATKAVAKKTPATKAAAKTTVTKKTPATKTAAKKTAAKKATAKKTAAKKSAAKKATRKSG